MEIPKFCALCEDDAEPLLSYGTGDTANEALNDFFDSGELDEQCAVWGIEPGDPVEIKIYSVVPFDQSDCPEGEHDSKWDWSLDDLVETRMVKAPPTEEPR